MPFALAEVLIERGNYPLGYERWAWTTTAVLAAGAGLAPVVRNPFPGLVLDLLVVSAYLCVYSFEPSSPVRELFFLVVLEGALLFGPRAALALPLASVPLSSSSSGRLPTGSRSLSTSDMCSGP